MNILQIDRRKASLEEVRAAQLKAQQNIQKDDDIIFARTIHYWIKEGTEGKTVNKNILQQTKFMEVISNASIRSDLLTKFFKTVILTFFSLFFALFDKVFSFSSFSLSILVFLLSSCCYLLCWTFGKCLQIFEKKSYLEVFKWICSQMQK
jgi:hypothetical protein